MPIRRVAATPSQEKEKASEPDATPEEPLAVDEEQAASSAAAAKGEEGDAADETEPTENGEKADEGTAEKTGEEAEKKDDKCKDCAAGQCTTHCYVLLPRLKDGYKYEKAKVKKIKKTIPAWASVTSRKNIPVAKFSGARNRLDDILFEAIKANDKAVVSYKSVMKYMMKKYPGLELERKKFFIKKAMKKHLEKGTIKQLKGKGLSGSFIIGKQPTSKKTTAKTESLGDALPLIITRLCEPKEASFFVIKKYLEQHFPSLDIENRPEVLKAALGKAVEKGQLDQITGKGARGTFQLKRTGNKVLLKGGVIEDAITAAITAMNEPKTCSITTLRKYLLDANKDSKEYHLVASLKRTLTKCKVLGWMEQITGHGFSGTYQLSFPFYPSPSTLYPDKFEETQKKKEEAPKRRRTVDSSDEEESEEEESEEEAPTRKRRAQKRPPPKVRHPVPAKKSRSASRPKAKGRPSNKSPAKKVASPTTKSASKARKPAASKKESPKATPVKRAAPAKKPKTPAVKKMTKRGGKRPAPKGSPPEEPAVEKEATKSRSKQPRPEELSSEEPAPRRESKRFKTEESSPKQPAAKKVANSNKQSLRKSKRGKN